MVERLDKTTPVDVQPLTVDKTDGLLIRTINRFKIGEDPRQCVRDLWVGHLRGKYSIDELRSVLDAFVNFLPESIKDELTTPTTRDKHYRTPLTLIAEEVKAELKPLSKGEHTHKRRELAAQRRDEGLSKS